MPGNSDVSNRKGRPKIDENNPRMSEPRCWPYNKWPKGVARYMSTSHWHSSVRKLLSHPLQLLHVTYPTRSTATAHWSVLWWAACPEMPSEMPSEGRMKQTSGGPNASTVSLSSTEFSSMNASHHILVHLDYCANVVLFHHTYCFDVAVRSVVCNASCAHRTTCPCRGCSERGSCTCATTLI